MNVSQVGADLGTAIPKWMAMGSPAYPSQDRLDNFGQLLSFPHRSVKSFLSKNCRVLDNAAA